MKKYKIVNKRRFFITNIIFLIIISVIIESLAIANADAIFNSLAKTSTTGFFH